MNKIKQITILGDCPEGCEEIIEKSYRVNEYHMELSKLIREVFVKKERILN